MSTVRTALGWVLPLVILGLGIGGFLLLGRQPPPERSQAPAPTAFPVRTVAVERETAGLTLEADGIVVPLREVRLAAEVAGRILRKNPACKQGQFVTAGTLLLEIDPRDYELDVERLERELEQAVLAIGEIDEEIVQNSASLDLSQRQVELARREVKRLEGLRAGRIVTESELDRAMRDELTAAGSVNTFQGQARILMKRRNRLVEGRSLASTLLEKARLDLTRTRIAAPTDGIIVEDPVEQDSFVSKGTPLVTIEDTSAAEVRTSLEMDDIARIWGGLRPPEKADRGAHEPLDTPATVVYRLGDAVYAWDGVLSRQEGRGLDEKTRTLPCRVLVADPTAVKAIDRYGAPMPKLPPGAPRSLLRGMFVEVRVHVESPEELVSIPAEAQRPGGDVWVMRDGRLVVLRPRVVQAGGGRVVFETAASGLEPGDRVVVSQIPHARSGMAVAEPAAAMPRASARDDGEDAT